MKLTILFTATAAALAVAAPAPAHGPMAWDGSNPFDCELQQLGTGVDFPDPDADPMCVQYDKTNQDLAGLGVVTFLANEPARIAIALDKCFYFQRDEWRGSVLEGGELETYHWTGSYYFDKARGAGGVHVEDVRVAGQAGDPSYVDFVPPPFNEFFHPTGGGGQVVFDMPADPRCAPSNGS
ncbi:MAG: hypothetical protein WD844_17155 [Thermoleophilaceae bacterium]